MYCGKAAWSYPGLLWSHFGCAVEGLLRTNLGPVWDHLVDVLRKGCVSLFWATLGPLWWMRCGRACLDVVGGAEAPSAQKSHALFCRLCP